MSRYHFKRLVPLLQWKWHWFVINALAVAAAVVIGIPLGQFIHDKITAAGRSPQTQSLPGRIADQQLLNAEFNYLMLADTRCKYCKDGIELLQKHGVKFRVIYLDEEPQKRYLLEQLGARGVPVLLSKSQFSIGFNERAWLTLVERTQASGTD